MFFTFRTKMVLAAALYTATASANLFECNSDQHAFPPKDGFFVVHYTSARDSSFNGGTPWIRICKPDGNIWTDVNPLGVSCDADTSVSFSTAKTGLNHPFVVTNGNGCNKGSSNLNGASMTYHGQTAVLQASNGLCGPRDNGISCQFALD
ncbi:hypothetical protein MVEN_00963700 [Mycena venus]|uniref:Uncharacterized protein n=1 Tax=Mycena venus TaxID=2733690 RepID=A0A8H6YDH2_9AGAR|nr:hypothetical protein MVEN_00963700 [Mycena venus]